MIQHQINWQPPRWTLTAAGLLPFAPERGTSSTRADYLFFGNEIKLTREEEELSGLSGALFLRANDKVFSSDSSRFYQQEVINTATAPQRPRVRKVPRPSRVRKVPVQRSQ